MIDVKVDFLLWVIFGVNNDFEVLLYIVSILFLCYFVFFIIGEFVFDGDFFCIGIIGIVYVNIVYFNDIVDDFFVCGNFIYNR